ncbi:MAG: hypothetical protein JRF63_01000, partial [Deltaproteobacteria bacterium]|nr:hypothetical protein [Deltaproteobacteria bacterium]
MAHLSRLLVISLALALFSYGVGCAKIESGEEDIDASTDADSDVDTDVDSDTDTDSDTDGDTDTDIDTDTDSDTDTDTDTSTGTDTGEDPCVGILCDTPPDDECEDDSTLWVYESPGECVEELDAGPDAGPDAGMDAGLDAGPEEGPFCVYDHLDLDCEYGCVDGGCNFTECTVGDCCVSGFYADTDLQCGTVEVSVEFGCETADCAADARERYQYQYCTGESADCTMGNLVWHDWVVLDNCAADEICESDLGGAWCTNCEFGCTDGLCDLDPCLDVTCDTPPLDYCIGPDNLRDYSNTGTCNDGDCEYTYIDIWCTYGCENQTDDDICGGDPCEGVTCTTPPDDFCVDGDTVREHETEGFCSNGICEYTFADVYCPYGCTSGLCDPPDCTSGTCCDAGFFRPDTYVCSTWSEYQCTGNWCGADPQSRSVSQYCSGSSATCSGSINFGGWTAIGNCTTDELCQSDDSDAWCMYCDFGCSGGACEGDPCEGVTCDTPPSDYCADANNLTVYDVPGTCSGGICSYTTHNEYCSFGCTAGSCDGDPCDGVTCNAPPSPICIDANTRRTYDSTGTCVDGTCEYGHTDVACEYGCTLGVCDPPDCSSGPCCTGGHFDPDSSACDSWLEVSCSNTSCGGDPRERTVTQYCSGASELCEGSIVNGGWTSTGDCVSADQYCDTDTVSAWCVDCEFGCSGGACQPDPCEGVNCTTPPANFCADADNLTVYDVPGTCSGGTCSYTTHNEFCSFGCTAGSCDGDPCQGVTCLSPPADSCVDADTLRVYSSPGTCTDGLCDYSYTDSNCTYGCDSGACNPPECASGPCCSGGFLQGTSVSCDSWVEYGCTSCDCGADGRSRNVTQYCNGAVPTCSGSIVPDSWTPGAACTASQICESDSLGAWCTDCPFGCTGGACDSDPCEGITCFTPPANFCADADNLTVYDVPGTCSGGVCSYTTHNEFCAFSCTGGSCDGDPCLGVTCLSPPADYCVDSDTVREYSSPGTCTDGICDYSYTDTACTYGCEFGACVVPDCTTGVC